MAWRSRAKPSRTPGRTTLTATVSSPSGVRMRALCTCAIEAAAIGSLNSRKSSSMGRPSAISTMRTASARGKGGIRSCSRSRSRAAATADDVGTGREELAELHVGRAEPGQRRREPGRAVAGAAPLDRAGEAQAQAGRRRQGARIDQRERAFARQDEAGAQVADEMEEAADHVRSSSRNEC